MNKKAMVIAPLLSLLLPGLGQVYNNQIRKGVTLALGLELFGFSSLRLGLINHFEGLVLLLAVMTGTQLFAVVDAFRIARKRAAETDHESAPPRKLVRFFVASALLSNLLFAVYTYDTFFPTRTYSISVGSMAPTLITGDWLVADMSYYRAKIPQRGDLIIFNAPGDEKWLKRVIAVGGDVIEGKNTKVYLNGTLLNEPYAVTRYDTVRRGDNFGPIVMPENHFFVMGDNRHESLDSRFPESGGPVSLERVKGKAKYIYWSPDRSRIGKEIK